MLGRCFTLSEDSIEYVGSNKCFLGSTVRSYTRQDKTAEERMRLPTPLHRASLLTVTYCTT